MERDPWAIAQGRHESVAMTVRVPFLDLRIADAGLRRELVAAVEQIFIHGRILQGPEQDAFEAQLADYCGTRYAVGVGSGTDALFIALRALGIGPGDEVIAPCLSFVGTANGIALAGATPVFVDVGPDLTIDVDRVARAISPRTRAIMPVHFTGKLCGIGALIDLAERHRLLIVEDAAPAIGATWRGRKAGSFSAASALSMNPMKLLNACGEAGAVLTNDPEVRDRALALRYNGVINKEFCHWTSLNGRLDTIQAAILSKRLARLEAVIERRRTIARRYHAAFANMVDLPVEADGYRDVYYTYTIQTDARDALQTYLGGRGIETKIQHEHLMPEHPAYRADVEGFAIGRRATRRILCLPGHENLSEEQIGYVIDSVQAFFKGGL
jgi:dTDP-4-amino-4,6-dideoxygalactose transaminase